MGEIFVHEGPHPDMPSTGERLTVGHLLGTDLEHFHRYYLARDFARGKDVLDIASGEGYGAALLAQVARSVCGVDVAAAAVAHARLAHPAANLRFEQGDACAIPLGDAAVDLVTSFETIEHFYDHDGFLREIRRVLRPGGLLLLSTPNRDIYSPLGHRANDYHVREMTREEFHAKCRAYFAHVAGFAQTTMAGSAILADRHDANQPAPLIFERRSTRHVEMSEGVLRAKYCLCFASDGPLPPLPGSLLVHSAEVGGADPDDMNESALGQRDAEIARLNEMVVERERHLRESVQALAELHALQTRIAAERQDRQFRRLSALLRSRDRAAARIMMSPNELNAPVPPQSAAQPPLSDASPPATAAAQPGPGRRWRDRLRPVFGLGGAPADWPRLISARRTLRRSALFQAAWYLDRYPDVRGSGLDPIMHYLRFGAAEGRDPGPGFSTGLYLQHYPDVQRAGINPLAHFERAGRAEGRQAFAPPPPAAAPAATAPAASAAASPPPGRLRIVYLSGEPDMAGHVYRVARPAEAARSLDAEVTVIRADRINDSLGAIAACHLLVIWRAGWNDRIAAAVAAARAGGAKIHFDVDDLMFEPKLATIAMIDGIRSQGFSEALTGAFFGTVAETVAAADFCTAPTEFLARRLRALGRPAFVLANGFDAGVWQQSRLALRRRAALGADGKLRIGYAAGSRTHQKDFSVAAPAVAEILRRRADALLVLFRRDAEPCLDIGEFPELAGLEDRIEWREMVPVEQLPLEMARLDVAIAPLQPGNPFCEAKSDLKFFESALVEVPIVATPSEVFRDAIRTGRTGFLAADDAAWRAALGRLVDEPELRRRIGRAAYLSVLWSYGPEARAERVRSVLAQQMGDAEAAAREFELDLRRRAEAPDPPDVPPHDVEVVQAGSAIAPVTVVLTPDAPVLQAQILEALDAVAAQTLAVIDLVLVETAAEAAVAGSAAQWLRDRAPRFNRLAIVTVAAACAVGPARNAGFAHAESPFVIPLDATVRLFPDFAARCLDAAERTAAGFVYPATRIAGGDRAAAPYSPARLACGERIGAAALVRLSAWAAAGGYGDVGGGEADQDLWCRFAERGLFGQPVTETLAAREMPGSSDAGSPHARHPWVLAGPAALG